MAAALFYLELFTTKTTSALIQRLQFARIFNGIELHKWFIMRPLAFFFIETSFLGSFMSFWSSFLFPGLFSMLKDVVVNGCVGFVYIGLCSFSSSSSTVFTFCNFLRYWFFFSFSESLCSIFFGIVQITPINSIFLSIRPQGVVVLLLPSFFLNFL